MEQQKMKKNKSHVMKYIILSLVNLRAGACFSISCISASTCFSIGLFFVTPSKTNSKYKKIKYLSIKHLKFFS